jgi:hypothetical protein
MGPYTDLLVSSTDFAGTITNRVLKAIRIPGATHTFTHFTAPEPASKRVVPNYYGIHTHAEVYLHVRAMGRPGLDIVCAGVKRISMMGEDDVMRDLKRMCTEGSREKMR